MNVHKIIEEALDGNDGIALPNPEEQSFCADEQVMKLASALQFIGNNLEYSVPTPNEIMAQAELLEKVAEDDDEPRSAFQRGADIATVPIALATAASGGRNLMDLRKAQDTSLELADRIEALNKAGNPDLKTLRVTAGLGGLNEISSDDIDTDDVKKALSKAKKMNTLLAAAGVGLGGLSGYRLYKDRKNAEKNASAKAYLDMAADYIDSKAVDIGDILAQEDAVKHYARRAGAYAAGGTALAALPSVYAATKAKEEQDRMRREGVSEADITLEGQRPAQSLLKSLGRGAVYGTGGALAGLAAGYKAKNLLGMAVGAGLGAVGGATYGGHLTAKKAKERADALIAKRKEGKGREKRASKALALGAAGVLGLPSAAAYSAHHQRKRMRDAGVSEADIELHSKDKEESVLGQIGRQSLLAPAGAVAGGMGALMLSPRHLGKATLGGLAAGGAYALKRTHDRRKAEADAIIQKYGKKGRKKSEKRAELLKEAEDRINPAKISAGPADPYSGEIMPNPGKVSNEFVGNTRDHHALIALKAQKVRDRINKDMKQYVSNVGDGYNLQGHLNKMNK